MNTDELTRALRDATTDVQPRPGFTDAVVRGGTRRRVRYRLKITAQVAVACAFVGAGTYAIWPSPAPQEQSAADTAERLTRPTAGDLAGDNAFLEQARQAFTAELPAAMPGADSEPTGRPHVFWAGRTPAGQVAVVAQEYRIKALERTVSWFSTGVVGTDSADGKVHLLALASGETSEMASSPVGFLFGAQKRVALVVSDQPVYFSSGPEVTADGKVRRDWTRLTPSDGVSVTPVTPPSGGWEPERAVLCSQQVDNSGTCGHPGALTGTIPRPATDDELRGASATRSRVSLNWSPATARPGLTWHVGDSVKDSEAMTTGFPYVLRERGFADQELATPDFSSFFVVAQLPNGQTAVVGEQANTKTQDYLFGVLYQGTQPRQVVYGGQIDVNAPLPVRLRLPDGQGWVVADKDAALSYRIGDGQWTDQGSNAALLPDDATQVRVTKAGSAPVTVDLPH